MEQSRARDRLNKELLLDLFYSTKGGIDEINAAIDARLQGPQIRKITLFEKYILARLKLNSRVLRMPDCEISPLEAVYLSQYPALKDLEVLDLRKNQIGDEGMEAIAQSQILKNLRELDLRSNQITRLGMLILAESTTLAGLEKLDLRGNKVAKRWEAKLKETNKFPRLVDLKTL